MTLTLDADEELECGALAIFLVDEQEYIALTPTEEEENEERSLFFFRLSEVKDEELELSNIEEDEELEMVTEAFEKLFGVDNY